MIMVQVIKEVAVNEELILEQNEGQWDEFRKTVSDDVGEFIKFLVEDNVLTVDDLGEVDYEEIIIL